MIAGRNRKQLSYYCTMNGSCPSSKVNVHNSRVALINGRGDTLPVDGRVQRRTLVAEIQTV